jgi:hypothetical protein
LTDEAIKLGIGGCETHDHYSDEKENSAAPFASGAEVTTRC